MPRLVRRRPLSERVMAYLNPLDFLLWLSEEFETREWDPKNVAMPAGIVFNLVFVVARANSITSRSYADDVFGDVKSMSFVAGLASFVANLLILVAVGNSAYTFLRKRNYRLFEASIDTTPSTPSARRVKVNPAQETSSPLRLLTAILGDTSAESRAHPDPTQDVWEVSVWDPLPICLHLFCFFSPGHVLVYMLFLPIAPSDPRPSTTVASALFVAAVLSVQLIFLKANFEQQAKDNKVIQREVLNEYDTKFVRPRLHKPVRDVGTQVNFDSNADDDKVDVYSPTTIIQRGFQANPNPNYAKHMDVEESNYSPRRSSMSPDVFLRTSTPTGRDSTVRRTAGSMRQPQFRQSTSAVPARTSVSTGVSANGGSLGVYTHPSSPLKKASSMHDMNVGSPRNSREMAAREVLQEKIRERSQSPVKRDTTSRYSSFFT